VLRRLVACWAQAAAARHGGEVDDMIVQVRGRGTSCPARAGALCRTRTRKR